MRLISLEVNLNPFKHRNKKNINNRNTKKMQIHIHDRPSGHLTFSFIDQVRKILVEILGSGPNSCKHYSS